MRLPCKTSKNSSAACCDETITGWDHNRLRPCHLLQRIVKSSCGAGHRYELWRTFFSASTSCRLQAIDVAVKGWWRGRWMLYCLVKNGWQETVKKKKTTKSESWISTLEEQGYPLSAPPWRQPRPVPTIFNTGWSMMDITQGSRCFHRSNSKCQSGNIWIVLLIPWDRRI